MYSATVISVTHSPTFANRLSHFPFVLSSSKSSPDKVDDASASTYSYSCCTSPVVYEKASSRSDWMLY